MKPACAVLWLVLVAVQATAVSNDVIPWEEAERYVGEDRTVEGTVVVARREGNVLRLTFDTAPHSFSVAVIGGLLSALPADAPALYEGRTVRASGRIRRFQGAAEMVIRDPSHLNVVDAAAEPVQTRAIRLEERVDDLEQRVQHLEESAHGKRK